MTLKVLLVLVLGIAAVLALPRPRRDHGHHDHHHGHVEYDHRHDVHHDGHRYDGHHHSDHHGGFRPHHDHRFRRAANGLRKARHHGGGFDAGFDAPYESFGEHGNYQGYQVHKHKRPTHVHKKTGFSASSAIAQSINTPYGTTHTISKTHAHSGTIDTFGKKR